jgi:outer membrane protein
MSKNIFLNALTLLNTVILLVLLAFYFLKDNRIVYVDSAKLLNNYRGMQDARKAYQQKASGWKANIDTFQVKFKYRSWTTRKRVPEWHQRRVNFRKNLSGTKQSKLVQYQQAMNAQAQQEDSKMTGEIVTQVNAFLKKYDRAKAILS